MEARRSDRRMRYQHLQARPVRLAPELRFAFDEDRLFDEQHAVVAAQSRHEMLRPLINETPAKVRRDDQAVHRSCLGEVMRELALPTL